MFEELLTRSLIGVIEHYKARILEATETDTGGYYYLETPTRTIEMQVKIRRREDGQG